MDGHFETQRSARGRSVSQNKKFGHSLLLSYKLSRIISRNIDRWMNNGQLNMKIPIGIFIQALGAKQTLIYEFYHPRWGSMDCLVGHHRDLSLDP